MKSTRGLFLWTCVFSLTAGFHASAHEPLPPPDVPADPPPVFSLETLGDIVVGSCNGNPVAVHFPVPRVTSACADINTVVCEPESGSLFPLGVTVVTCWMTNACGESATNSFTVTVQRDGASPTIECPATIVAYATSDAGAVVDYPLPAVTDDGDPAPALSCTPPPGSMFDPGNTTVTCTAVDACGNVATCSFVVEVRPPELRIRAEVDATGGAGPVVVEAKGFDALDTTTDLLGEWLPLAGSTVVEPPSRTNVFYRPPLLEGAVRAPGPLGELAYVSVGPLAAYSTPGFNPARGLTDSQTLFGVKILSGDSGGTANRWSGPQNMPFTFYFFGRPYKQFRVSKNGLLTFSTNIVTGTEGLSYFNFSAAGPNSLTNRLPLWTNGFAVDNTVFGLAGRYVTQSSSDDVFGYLHGSPPYRQAWIVFRHPKDLYGQTVTAIVLEETSNRIFIMDMDTDAAGDSTSRLVAGVQGELNSLREVQQPPASPFIQLVSRNGSLADNAVYLFHPHILMGQVKGQAAPQLMTATNLDRYITEQMRQANIPGMTVAISRNGRLILNKAYGYANVEKRELMQPYHRACIGSVSKMFAAFAIEKLIDDGVIASLNEWPYAPSRMGKQWFWDGVNEGITNNIHTNFSNATFLATLTNVTLRHLLSHTAGFANRNDDLGAANAYADGDYTQLTPQQQVRRFIATQRLITNGVALLSAYSNPSFKQLGVFVEEVVGESYESWILDNLLIPGGAPFARLMRTYENEETFRDARRYLYYPAGRVPNSSPVILRADSPWGNSRITGAWGPVTYGDAIYANAADGAAGSLTATAHDLVRFMAAIDGMPNKTDILPPERFNELEQRFFPAVSQGIGWDNVSVSGNSVWKNGNISYGASHLVRSTTADRLTVAVVSNTGANVTTLGNTLFNIVRAVPPISPFYDLFQLPVMLP
ncbi:MAG TPA: serine hydrolase [Verrucomicrobiae bacterium]|nr:serine hydrolase [Verrucomicrobiae bacterium]